MIELISQTVYFLRINFRFQLKVCGSCHDIKQKSMSFDDTAIVTVKRYDYRISFWFMAKNDDVDRMKNAVLSKKLDNDDSEKNNYLS